MDVKKRERLLAILAIVFFGVLVGDKLILSPLLSLWKNRSERIIELKTKVEDGHALVEREDMIKRRWQDWEEQALPVDQAEAENSVLQAASRWSRESRLGLNLLKPRWIDDEEDHMKLECRAAAEGRLDSIARFLYELERDPLALKIEEVQITSRDSRGDRLTLGVRFTGLLLLTGEDQ